MNIPAELSKQVSLIVCTVDRLADLERCLASAEPFRAELEEIIVVNNGPLAAAVADIAARHGARVVTERRRGIAKARNAGARNALGKIIVFLDDDAQAVQNWLPHLISSFSDPTVDAVMGAVQAEDPCGPVQQCFADFVNRGRPDGPVRFDARAARDPFPLRMAMSGFTMNVAMRRDVFERFGYFDERFGRGTRIGSGEDPDFFFNVLRLGGRIVFEPRATVLHRWPADERAWRRSIFNSACGHTALLTKYFLEEPALRPQIRHYIVSRLRRERATGVSGSAGTRIPRLPFLLGSLYGPIAFLLSRKK